MIERIAIGLGANLGEPRELFAAALRKLLEDKALRQRMAMSARQLGQELPDWTDTARIVGAALESVL